MRCMYNGTTENYLMPEVIKYRRALWKAAENLTELSDGYKCPNYLCNQKHKKQLWACCYYCTSYDCEPSIRREKRCWFLFLLGKKNVTNVWKESRQA